MLHQPFFQITLPLMVAFVGAIWAAYWSQSKHLQAMEEAISKQLDAIERCLTRIEAKLL